MSLRSPHVARMYGYNMYGYNMYGYNMYGYNMYGYNMYGYFLLIKNPDADITESVFEVEEGIGLE